MPTNRWVHLMATFDGKQLIIYVDGVEGGRASAAGKLTIPPAFEAQYLAVGSDSSASGLGENFMTGKLGSAAIYSEPLSASEIMEIYNNSKPQ
jgi:hypothetical protein